MTWCYHVEGRRAFILDADGYEVCEIVAPANNDRVAIAEQIVRDHNRVLAEDAARRKMQAPVCMHCGSKHVAADAVAMWSTERQDWVVCALCDEGHSCVDCGRETELLHLGDPS